MQVLSSLIVQKKMSNRELNDATSPDAGFARILGVNTTKIIKNKTGLINEGLLDEKIIMMINGKAYEPNHVQSLNNAYCIINGKT
jgi:hypothetical protein